MKEGRTPEFRRLPAGTALYHVYRDAVDGESGERRRAIDFNPHVDPADSWRFSPFPDDGGKQVASWYGALSSEGALFETVFRDAVMLERPAIRRKRLAGRVICRLTLDLPVELIKLHGTGLMQLGLKTSFTASEPRTYPRSRRIARILHRQFPDAHGLIWRSRINNDEFSLVLFGDRTPAAFATPQEFHALDSGKGITMVMKAASGFGCTVN